MFLCRSQGTECTGRPAPSHGPEDLQGPGLILAGSWWRGGSAAASAQRDVAGPPVLCPEESCGLARGDLGHRFPALGRYFFPSSSPLLSCPA